MIKVKAVQIDGESIYIFSSAIYLIESIQGYTLELNLIVSEVVIKKYQKEEKLIVEFELDDHRLFSSIMDVLVLPGKIPIMNLVCVVDDFNEFSGIQVVNENDSEFPSVDESITIEEIRKVEMPDEKISLKLNLPIDQVEWLRNHKAKDINQLFKEWIYDYWQKQN